MYFSIKCIIMDDFLQKKSIGDTVVNTPFAGMSVLLKDFVFLLDFDKHSSLFTQFLHTYML